jgi:hypothetical protein
VKRTSIEVRCDVGDNRLCCRFVLIKMLYFETEICFLHDERNAFIPLPSHIDSVCRFVSDSCAWNVNVPKKYVESYFNIFYIKLRISILIEIVVW